MENVYKPDKSNTWVMSEFIDNIKYPRLEVLNILNGYLKAVDDTDEFIDILDAVTANMSGCLKCLEGTPQPLAFKTIIDTSKTSGIFLLDAKEYKDINADDLKRLTRKYVE